MSTDGKKTKNHKQRNGSHQLNPEERIEEYKFKARESWDEAWRLLHSSGWKIEAGTDLVDGVVYAQHVRGKNKVFMLQGYVEASPEFVFNNTVKTLEDSINWNPTITEIRTLQVIDDCTDITYNATADAAGGLVASRDFITIRHWETRDGITLSGGCAVEHPDMPPNKKHVRGENKAGGWIFKPVPDNKDRCIFGWIVDTDIKGWIPQYIVDQTISGTLLLFLRHLRTHIESVKAAAK